MRFIPLTLAAIGAFATASASTAPGGMSLNNRHVSPNPAHEFEKRQGATAVFNATVNVNFPRTVDALCVLPALGTTCSGISGLTVRSTLTSVIGLLTAFPNPIARYVYTLDVWS
jgi:hypothetical protein